MQYFSILLEIPSYPEEFLFLRDFIISLTSISVTVTVTLTSRSSMTSHPTTLTDICLIRECGGGGHLWVQDSIVHPLNVHYKTKTSQISHDWSWVIAYSMLTAVKQLVTSCITTSFCVQLLTWEPLLFVFLQLKANATVTVFMLLNYTKGKKTCFQYTNTFHNTSRIPLMLLFLFSQKQNVS